MLSAVEHFGLEHYGQDAIDERLDLDALARLRELVVPGGLLVPTVPFAEQATVDDFQRVYDEAGLRELLGGWDVLTSLRLGRIDRMTWQLGEPSRERHGVALVTARRADRHDRQDPTAGTQPGRRWGRLRLSAYHPVSPEPGMRMRHRRGSPSCSLPGGAHWGVTPGIAGIGRMCQPLAVRCYGARSEPELIDEALGGRLVVAPAQDLRAVADAPVGGVVEGHLDDELGPQRHPFQVAALRPARRVAAAALAGLVGRSSSTSSFLRLAVKPLEWPTSRSRPSGS